MALIEIFLNKGYYIEVNFSSNGHMMFRVYWSAERLSIWNWVKNIITEFAKQDETMPTPKNI